jgi:hypothetical protein
MRLSFRKQAHRRPLSVLGRIMKQCKNRALAILAILALVATMAPADEGMWTFDNLPVKQLKERYGFTPTQAWLDHLRLASVRFNDGGSGSFVSPAGLVLTNHHVARGQLQKLSTAAKDYVREGFYANTRSKEVKTPDLELNVLVSMENVTAAIQGAADREQAPALAFEARKKAISSIEKASLDATGLRSDVVSLYHGGEYWLYRYKKYTDVRLVFAPEQQAAFFGGDLDNFTYPRFDIDFAIFRVYENSKPIRSPNYLRWNSKGAAEGELVFVAGHPGSTDRLATVAQLEMLRDPILPGTLAMLRRRIGVLKRYATLGPEQARQADELRFSLENSLKAQEGEYRGLQDHDVMQKKREEEAALRSQVEKNAHLRLTYGDAWGDIDTALRNQKTKFDEYRFRSLRGSYSRLVSDALAIRRYAQEIQKPDSERLDGFHDSQLASLRMQLLSTAPAYPRMEEALLADWLQESLDHLGKNDPFIQTVLSGDTPQVAAKRLLEGTKLGDASFRQRLLGGGEVAILASKDPLIVLARELDPIFRQQQQWLDDNVLSLMTKASEKIAKARFAIFGTTLYPDATFTLRLAYGTVKGYPFNGTVAPPRTTFYGLYDRSESFGSKAPFDLPGRFLKRKNVLDLSTPLNFVSTCDIIGGNSGSPVVNREGELVGLIFDGNIESLVGRFVYDARANRAVAVHAGAIIEVLEKVYGAAPLVAELRVTAHRTRGVSNGRTDWPRPSRQSESNRS